jgi:hypothetical protein
MPRPPLSPNGVNFRLDFFHAHRRLSIGTVCEFSEPGSRAATPQLICEYSLDLFRRQKAFRLDLLRQSVG